MSDRIEKIKTILSHPKWPAMLAIGWLCLVSLLWKGELNADDFFHRAMLQGSDSLYSMGFEHASVDRSFSEKIGCLFCFIPKGEENVAKFKEMGVIPWWTAPDLQISFWRPFSAMTHWLDYQLWPDNPNLMQYHSLAWDAGVIFFVALLFQMLFKGSNFAPWVAGLAVLLFTVDVSLLGPVKWLANRNAVIAAFWGVATLLLHLQWRREGGVKFALLSMLTLLLALLSGEGGIATFAYLFAFALCLDESNYKSRMLSLLPAFFIIVAWRIVYKTLEYGAFNSGMYLDPINESGDFLLSVVDRGVALLFFQYSGIDGIYNIFSPNTKIGFWLFAVGFLSIVGVVLTPLLKNQPVARFLLVGSIISVIPSCANAVPSGRLLFFASMGASGLVAMLIATASATENRMTRYLRRYFITVHLVFGTISWVLVSVVLLVIGPAEMPKTLALENVKFDSSKKVVMLTVPNPFMVTYLHFYREYMGLPQLHQPRLIAPAYTHIVLHRKGPKTIQLLAPYGLSLLPETNPSEKGDGSLPLFSPAFAMKAFSGILRSSSSPFEEGEVIELSDMKVDINQVNEVGEPLDITVEFQQELNDITWFAWNGEDELYFEVVIPEVGKPLELTSSL